jgi:acyl-CoA synthetase (AMP-forming)/AMP-acid ligase II
VVDGPGDVLRVAAARFGDKPALVPAVRTLGYGELDALSDRVAAGLVAPGVRPGQPVSLYAQNRWEWVVAYHGALKAGAVVKHPGVAMVAAGPVPDPVKGELACAYVVPATGASPTEEELIAYAGERLAAYKRPRLVRFVDSLPSTSTGKIMRRELIKRFAP